jgi:hypothetical protein
MGIKDWICDWNAEPDLKQIVEKTLALFGVFTGATLSFYVKDFVFGANIPAGFRDFSFGGRLLVAISVIALLLRYIIGSAVHLNATYVPKVTAKLGPVDGNGEQALIEDKQVKSKSLRLLIFDIAMLVAFGILAVSIIYSVDFDEFLVYSSFYILAGLLWSLAALMWRPGDAPIAERWSVIDFSQLVLTLGLFEIPWSDFTRAALLAPLYVFCLFLDLCVVSRPAPAVVVAPPAGSPVSSP